MIKTLLLIGTGGFLGSVFRFLGQEVMAKLTGQVLAGTFTVNILGSFIIGLVYGLWAKEGFMHPGWKFFLATGFCGGFTTFSTFSFENLSLLQSGAYVQAALYISSSLLAGLFITFLGLWLAGKLLSL